VSAHDVTQRLASTGRLLVRSATEIASVLESMRDDGDLVTASIESGEVLFLSRLLGVEPQQGTIVLACSDQKHANSALLAERLVTLRCNHRGAHYEFAAGAPHETQYAGALAIQLTFPVALLALQRRAQPRTAVPPRVPLRCEVRFGALSFDASVVDISLGGIGSLVYDAAIRIDPGTRIERARILHPQREPVVADLEVRYVARVQLPDGRPANRAGCRVFASAADIEALIRLFVTELE